MTGGGSASLPAGGDGVLVVDKPPGMTSFDVVDRVRRQRRARKAGHTGTLDPMATGVLPVCLGEATKLVPFLVEGDKVYRAEIALGIETDTQDAAGQVTRRSEVQVSLEALQEALGSFVGTIQQVPPMHSARHHQGRRLYDLARAGIQVDRPARPVEIRRLELLAFDGARVTIEVACSKGTYIRVLAADLGQRVGCGAHLVGLRRTSAFPFTIDQAWPLEGVGGADPIPPDQALDFLPRVEVPADLAQRIRRGCRLPPGLTPQASGLVRLVGPPADLVAVAEATPDGLRLRRVLRGS